MTAAAAAGDNPLGDYLRARRGRLTPDQVGFPSSSRRRVAGLRREEVAMLAGISGDYYLRLEQGRDRHPSAQVLDALAAALRLDDTAAAYLRSLAAPPTRSSTRRARRETVPTGIVALVDSLPFPAFVEGRYLDVLAANSLATALSPRITVGRNRLLDVFLDVDEYDLYIDWDDATARLVAGFHHSIGTAANDPRCIELVGELSIASPRFRHLWAQHDVRSREGAPIDLEHPLVGRLRLNREKLAIDSATGGLVLAIYHPNLGSPDAEKLTLLASYTHPGVIPQHASHQQHDHS
jgi:transcriptional regulator with XRE-family HTH domain